MMLTPDEMKQLEQEPLIKDLLALMTGNGAFEIDDATLGEFISHSAILILNKFVREHLNGKIEMPEYLQEELMAYLYFNNKLINIMGVA